VRNFSSQSKGLYKSAITGAYFGILNIFLVLVPLIYSLFYSKVLFTIYMIIGVTMLLMLAIIPYKYKNIRNYEFSKLRYLYFVSSLFLVFFLGILLKYICNFGFSFSNIYIILLQLILILMSFFDILLNAHSGTKRMKSLYLRTINIQYFKNFLVIISGIVIGILFLIPYYIF